MGKIGYLLSVSEECLFYLFLQYFVNKEKSNIVSEEYFKMFDLKRVY